MSTTEFETLDERHGLGDGVTVEIRYTGGHVVSIWIEDPLGTDEFTVPEGADPYEFFHHPYALAFPGRNPWDRALYVETDDTDDTDEADDLADLTAA